MKITAAGAALIAAATLSACTSSFGSSDGGQPAAGGKYIQTWPGSYKDLRCSDWIGGVMTRHEKFVAAHDFLVALKATRQDDAFAHGYARDISTDCKAGPSLKVSEVAAALATIDKKDFG